MKKDICFAKSANLSCLQPFYSKTNLMVALEIVTLRGKFMRAGTQRSIFTIWVNSRQFGKFMGQSNSSLQTKIMFTFWRTVFGGSKMKNLTTSSERKTTLISQGTKNFPVLSRRWNLVSKLCCWRALSNFNLRLQSKPPASSTGPFLISIAIWRKLMIVK